MQCIFAYFCLETKGTLKSPSDLKRVCHHSLQCGQCFMLSFITKILSVVTGMPNTEEAEQSLSRLREERRRVLSLDSDTKYLDRDNAKDTKDPGVDYFIKSTISLTFLNFACFAYLAHFACFAYFAHFAYFPNLFFFLQILHTLQILHIFQHMHQRFIMYPNQHWSNYSSFNKVDYDRTWIQ